eukprot:CAMPEP_0168194868 /NCGR_PEP_ID=MMETSP0139_2-20121125/19483_1 /TAXON_ID=44445 /ORGANISM="Pseudo-nitzschia australis, Strain 10249 10 AB" /LENGTH=182 /DNA_ID=CAMNT_0008118547 /DNA_START=28 /DNA_END=573 /DNA_ORIENTATION=+
MTVTSNKIHSVEGGIASNVTRTENVELVDPEAVVPVHTNQVGYDAKAVNVVVIEPADAPEIGRQSKLCCGSCCDVRRATTIVNIIHIIFSAFGLLTSWLGFVAVNRFGLESVEFTDDNVKAEIATFGTLIQVVFAMNILSIFFGALGIYGAVKYNKCLVFCVGIWYCSLAIFRLVTWDFLGW